MHISISPEVVFMIGDWPITNAILLSSLAFVFTVTFMLFVSAKVRKKTRQMDKTFENPDSEKIKKDGFFTRLAIWCFEGLYNTVKQVIPNGRIAKMVAPFSISIFFFVVFNYYFGILPFVGESITIGEHATPLFRGAAADLNFTFMLAILTIVMVQVYAFKALGIRGNLQRYFVNPFKDPVGSFSGILELIGEFSRMLALSMRLFGNCFAGEILLIVVGTLTSVASPVALPFFFIFELFIGGIQAYIFFMLATVFVSIAVSHGDHGSDHSTEAKQLSEVTS